MSEKSEKNEQPTWDVAPAIRTPPAERRSQKAPLEVRLEALEVQLAQVREELEAMRGTVRTRPATNPDPT